MSQLGNRVVQAVVVLRAEVTTIYSPKVLKPSLSGPSLTLRNIQGWSKRTTVEQIYFRMAITSFVYYLQ